MKNPATRTYFRSAMVLAAMSLVLSGCVSNPVKRQQAARYVPRTGDRRPWDWMADNGKKGTEPVQSTKGALKVGDRMIVYLRAIPMPDKFEAIINRLGEVNFPHIGVVSVKGLTTAEAEKRAETTYISQGIYKSISVIILPQFDEYFVTGEVQRPTKYPFSGEVTLLQAIAAAGGYTDYANPKRIEVRRKATGITDKYDGRDIAKGKAEDPAIQPGDIIRVHEHW